MVYSAAGIATSRQETASARARHHLQHALSNTSSVLPLPHEGPAPIPSEREPPLMPE